MTIETRQINAINATWSGASGAATDIDEPIGSPDTAYYGPGPESDSADFGFEASAVADVDVVSNISFNLIFRDDGTAGNLFVDVDLLIGGTPVGTTQRVAVDGADTQYNDINDVGWNVDRTAAEMDGAELRLTPENTGMPGTSQGFLETGNMVVTYAEPTDFDQLGFRFYEDSAVGADSLAPMAAENTNATMVDPTVDTFFHWRDEFDETTSNGTAAFGISPQYRKNGVSWTTITASSSNVQAAANGEACTTADGDATLSDLLTTSVKTHAQSEYEANNGTINIDGPADRHYENHHCFKMIAADVVATDFFDFRNIRITEGAFGTYTRIGRLTLTAAGANTPVAANVAAGAVVGVTLVVDYFVSSSISAGAAVVHTRVAGYFRASNIAAGAAVVAARVAEHFRSSNIGSGAVVAASFFRTYPVASNVAAGAAVAVTKVVDFFVAATTAAGGAVVATRFAEYLRASNIAAGGAVTTTRVAGFFRSSSIAAGAAVAVIVAKHFDIAATVAAGAAVATSRFITFAETSAIAAGAAVVASRFVEYFRSSNIAAGAAIAHTRFAEYFRASNIAAGASVAASLFKTFPRSASIAAGASVNAVVALSFDIAAAIAAGASVLAENVFTGGGGGATRIQLVRGLVRKAVRGLSRGLFRKGDQ